MTIDELIFEQRLKALERVNQEHAAYVDAVLAQRRGGTRRAIARALVQLGVAVDRDAGERAVLRRQTSH